LNTEHQNIAFRIRSKEKYSKEGGEEYNTFSEGESGSGHVLMADDRADRTSMCSLSPSTVEGRGVAIRE
jgi:hypothetical protein